MAEQKIMIKKNDLGYYLAIDDYPVPVEGKMYYGSPEEMAAANAMAKRILLLAGMINSCKPVCASCDG